MTGWLVEQLPEAMRRQKLLAAFALMGEQIADSIRFQLSSLDAQLDPHTATDPMLEYLAGWFGFALDARTDADLLRRLLEQVGPIIRSRGTKHSLEVLLTVLSGGPATVDDPGIVVGPGGQLPPASGLVAVRLAQAGPLGLDRLAAIARRELPVGVELAVTLEGSS